jgi:hypothetical protein
MKTHSHREIAVTVAKYEETLEQHNMGALATRVMDVTADQSQISLFSTRMT